MLEAGFYNMDCMDGMKEFPDKYFDLAIVDPPYGDASQNRGGYWNRFGERFERYRTTRTAEECQAARRNMGLRELEADGRRDTTRQKNCHVGRCPETGIFQ